MTRRVIATFVVLSLAIGSACSGPTPRLAVGVREVPSDVILGEQGQPDIVVAVPVPPTAFDFSRAAGLDLARLVSPAGLTPSNSDGPQTPTTLRTTTTPPDSCPTADPLSAPRREATSRITAPPRAGTVTFRNAGTFKVTGASPREGAFNVDARRTVQNVRMTATGSYVYDVVAALAGTTTTSTYQVMPEQPGSVGSTPGLYLVAVRTKRADGSAAAGFQPPLALKLVDIPIVPGTSFTTAGTDPTSGVTMKYTSTAGSKTRVDACGTLLDAITLDLTDGRVDGPDMNIDFTARYAIATQFGGLSIRDNVTQQGLQALDSVFFQNTAIINEEPAA